MQKRLNVLKIDFGERFERKYPVVTSGTINKDKDIPSAADGNRVTKTDVTVNLVQVLARHLIDCRALVSFTNCGIGTKRYQELPVLVQLPSLVTWRGCC